VPPDEAGTVTRSGQDVLTPSRWTSRVRASVSVRQRASAVNDNAHGRGTVRQAHGKAGVIGDDRADAYDNGIYPGAQTVQMLQRTLAVDVEGFSGRGRHTPVKRLADLADNAGAGERFDGAEGPGGIIVHRTRGMGRLRVTSTGFMRE
jgi:hypothetical protein